MMPRVVSKRRVFLIGLEVAVPVALLALWWSWSASAANPFFPPLSRILERFQELWLFDHFVSDILPSLGNLLLSFVLAGASGIVLGVIFGLVRPVSDLLYPIVNFFRAIPTVAIIPIFIVLLGFGNDVRVLTIVLAALPPALIGTLDGVRAVEPQITEVGRVFRLTRLEKIIFIYLPGASPQIFTGLQVSLQFSFIVMIASEMLGSSHGIGAMTLLAQQTFASTDMWAGVILLGLIGYLANLGLSLVRNRLLRWYDGAKQSEREF